MYPHIRFAAFLLAKKKSVNIKDIPMPGPSDVSLVYPNIRATKKWYAFSKTEELNKKTPEARLAYSLWANKPTRIFLYVAFLRHLENTAVILKQHFRIETSEKTLELYERLFFDISQWDRIDLENYCSLLQGEDREVFESCLSLSETESILTAIGVKLVQFDHDSYLHNMFFMAYERFMKEPDLAWGKFAVQLEKRISDVSSLTKKDILKDLNLELEGLQKADVFDFEDVDQEELEP
jgi:hypothetical protein